MLLWARLHVARWRGALALPAVPLSLFETLRRPRAIRAYPVAFALPRGAAHPAGATPPAGRHGSARASISRMIRRRMALLVSPLSRHHQPSCSIFTAAVTKASATA